jgi:hypothetical protein
MIKSIILPTEKWYALKSKLQQDHPKSVVMVRWKMREVLGFTEREHEEWGMGYQQRQIHLDFFDEKKKTFFLLKYGSYISSEVNNDK